MQNPLYKLWLLMTSLIGTCCTLCSPPQINAASQVNRPPVIPGIAGDFTLDVEVSDINGNSVR